MRQRSARPLATALVAGLVVFGLGACSSDESKFARHLESAREFEEEGKNKEALLELRSALQKDPDFLPARVALGRALLTARDPALAEANLRKAESLGAAMLGDRIEARFSDGQHRAAILRLEPEFDESQFFRLSGYHYVR